MSKALRVGGAGKALIELSELTESVLVNPVSFTDNRVCYKCVMYGYITITCTTESQIQIFTGEYNIYG